MLKDLRRIIVVFLFGCSAGFVPVAGAEEPPLWFNIGEELIYRVYWGIIPVASSHVTTRWVEENGRKLIQIHFRTKTNRVLATLYPVDDVVESIIDPDGFLPIRFTKTLSEGHYQCDEVTTFDRTNLVATWESRTNGKKKQFAIEPDTRDIVSFMYFMRSRRFVPGQNYDFKVMADEKLYDLKVQSVKTEKVHLAEYEDVPSVKLEPQASFGGIFVRKGRMWMWVSEDPRRLCTKVAAEVPVANVNIVLYEVLGPGNDFWIAQAKSVGTHAAEVVDVTQD